MTTYSEADAGSPMGIEVQLTLDVLSQLRLGQYICVAMFSAATWDLVLGFDCDIALFQLEKYRISTPYLIYCLSRILTLLTVTLMLVYALTNSVDCGTFQKAAGTTIAISGPLTSLLMYFRIQAVYNRSPFIKAIFCVLWLGVLGTSILVPFVMQSIFIAGLCLPMDANNYAAAGVVVATVYDSLIFLAISYRLIKFHSPDDSWRTRARCLFRGEGLHKTSKTLLKSGQIYYASTVAINLLAVAAAYSTLPPLLRLTIGIPSLSLPNLMACTVYRSMRLGLIKDDLLSSTPSATSQLIFV